MGRLHDDWARMVLCCAAKGLRRTEYPARNVESTLTGKANEEGFSQELMMIGKSCLLSDRQ